MSAPSYYATEETCIGTVFNDSLFIVN